ncbi:putative prophage LambdaCh01, replication protein O [Bacillus methanolicus PB1]|uniref:Putative prophage LambdaCh01, replication protein O n=1 Tax=Bacillus methanolicus PB1 TaxID=997296 RepID=I3DY39_BACMT|nr:hypothetical protein [Bacillus methanolicus]EIJ79160.1 putative prophage LambdaCh01, replication protein O [Bacillus methanolicus PB1]
MEKQIQASGFVIQPRLQFKNIKDKMLYQLFLDLANFKDDNLCKRGQLITSSLKLSDETGWSRGEIRGSIKRLEDDGYIKSEPFKKNKGLIITIIGYDDFQKLGNYNPKNNQLDSQQDSQHENQPDNQQTESSNPCDSKEECTLKEEINQQDSQQDNQQKNQLNNHTITAYINSINNINKTLKEYIVEAPVKNKNLSSTEEIETFVDFALRTNALPSGTSRKILIAYFDCIRLTRQTCTISANILVNFIEKIKKYSINQIHYALWKHIDQHDDKKESYTLGILRNTNEHEARRGLIKLKNKGGGLEHAVGSENSEYDFGF